MAFRARWVFPVDRPPIESGIVTIAGSRIVAVGENASSQPARDLGNVALIPGLVNAHTHLEFSLLNQPLGESGMPFAAWIGEVVSWRAKLQQELSGDGLLCYRLGAIAAGQAESDSAGVATLGEIARLDLPVEEYALEPPTTTRLFGELLGLATERVEPLIQRAYEYVRSLPDNVGHLHLGLSPHAPYSVHPELLRRTCELSATLSVPLAMHLAESREELELLQAHTGPLVELLQTLGAWHPNTLPRGLRPLDYLRTLATAHHALVIHGNYLTRNEFEFLAAHRDRMSLVYCPRTHGYFGHDPYPLAELLAAGVRVAVGTDSRASNPDLRLWEELRHIARQHPGIQPATILHMGTIAGAEALGLADQFGSITDGKSARLAAIRLQDVSGEPHELLFSSTESATPVVMSPPEY